MALIPFKCHIAACVILVGLTLTLVSIVFLALWKAPGIAPNPVFEARTAWQASHHQPTSLPLKSQPSERQVEKIL
jgi:hypothetical protein